MSAIQSIEWTRPLLNAERDYIGQPFAVVSPIEPGEVWTAATNGWALLAVREDFGYERADAVLSLRTAKYLNLIADTRAAAIPVDLAALRTFAGEAPSTFAELEARRDDGIDVTPCIVADAVFDRELLAQWLRGLPSGVGGLTPAEYLGDFMNADGTNANPMILHGDGWALAVMPVKDTDESRRRSAVFPLATTEAHS